MSLGKSILIYIILKAQQIIIRLVQCNLLFDLFNFSFITFRLKTVIFTLWPLTSARAIHAKMVRHVLMG